MSSGNAPDQARDSRETLEQPAWQDARLHEVHAQAMREKDEPTEGFAPLPIALVFLFCVLCFGGGVYLIEHSAGFDPLAYNENIKPTTVAPPPPQKAPPFENGAKLYRKNCLQCHQESGMGVPGAFPPLVESQWVLGSEERLVKILLHGLAGPIEVRGNTYNGNMPAVGTWDDYDIASVATYIRGNTDWGNDAGEVTEDTVAAVRADFAGRSTTWTADELLEMYPLE